MTAISGSEYVEDNASEAQLDEQVPSKHQGVGSNPTGGSNMLRICLNSRRGR